MVAAALFMVSVLRALVEVAGLCLVGQGVLYLLAGAAREGNTVFRMLCIVTRPVLRLVRRVTPRAIVDRHLPVFVFLLLFGLWIALAAVRRLICAANGLACG
jgi:uncharacterized protein YggT (Ycf19 family)